MKITLLLVTVLAFLCFVDGKPPSEGKRAHQIKRAKEHEMSNRMGHGDHHRREHSIAHRTDMPHRSDTHEMHKIHKADPVARKSSVHKKAEAIHRRGDGVHRTNSGSTGTSTIPVHDIKKDLHLQHVTEHNIQKKQHDDKQQQKAEVTGTHLITNRMPRGEEVPSHLLTNRTPQVSANLNSSAQATRQAKNITKDGIPMESERLIHVTPRPQKMHKVNKSHHKTTPTTAVNTNTPIVSHQRPSSSKAKAHKPPKKFSAKKHGWKKSTRKEKGKDKAKDKRERREKRNKALHRSVVDRNL